MKAFATLMLDLCDMNENDTLYQFMEGLQTWARNELPRRRVKELAVAQTMAERLEDFSQQDTTQRKPK